MAGTGAGDDQRERWEKYLADQFQGQHPLEAMHQIWSFQEPLYGRIQQLVKPPARVLEVGTGSGVHVCRLSMLGYHAVGVDNSEKIIDFARGCAARFGFDVQLEVADAFNLEAFHGRFDLVFSTGMIEHWSGDRLVAALREQVRCGPIVVAEIPTKHTHFAARATDEIPYSSRQLQELFAQAGLGQTVTFGYGSVPNLTGVLVSQLPPRLQQRVRRRGMAAMALGCYGRLGVQVQEPSIVP